jgi:hypothetical protein
MKGGYSLIYKPFLMKATVLSIIMKRRKNVIQTFSAIPSLPFAAVSTYELNCCPTKEY